MKINRKTKSSKEISTSSMPDIIFMLLIFFMVTTVMRVFEGLNVTVPRAQTIKKLDSKRNTSYVWATKDGLVSIDDKLVNVEDMNYVMAQKIIARPKLTVSGKFDKDAPMELITDIHEELRESNAIKLSYSALTEITE